MKSNSSLASWFFIIFISTASISIHCFVIFNMFIFYKNIFIVSVYVVFLGAWKSDV